MLKAALRDSFVYGLSSILTKGLAIFLLPLYTRVMSAEEYGAYDIIITLGTIANILVALEISQGLSRHWVDAESESDKVKYASSALLFSVVMYLMFFAVAYIFSPGLALLLLGNSELLVEFRIGLASMSAAGIYYLILNQFRWEIKSRVYAMVSIFYALTTLLFALILCVGLDLGLSGVMQAQLGAALASAMLGWVLLRHRYRLIVDFEKLKLMLRFSIPLVPSGLALLVSLYANRFAINHYFSLEQVAIYGLGSRIAGLAALMIVGIQVALTPLVYRHHKEPDSPEKISRLFGWFLAIALPGCLFLSLFSVELLHVFATPEFSAAAGLVAILSPALLLSQMYIFAPGIVIAKKTQWQLMATLVAATFSVLANWWLVPVWGVYGAAFATLFGALMFFMFWTLLGQKLYRIPYRYGAVMVSLIAYVVLAWIGHQVNAMMVTPFSPGALLVKVVMLAVIFVVVVVSGLLPPADIRKGWVHGFALLSRRRG